MYTNYKKKNSRKLLNIFFLLFWAYNILSIVNTCETQEQNKIAQTFQAGLFLAIF